MSHGKGGEEENRAIKNVESLLRQGFFFLEVLNNSAVSSHVTLCCMATEINRKRYIFIQFYVQGLSLQKAVVSV
jgi:hypothetical protein